MGVRMLCSYVTLLSKGKGTDGELYLEDFLSQASLMTTALSLESLRLAAAVSFCLHGKLVLCTTYTLSEQAVAQTQLLDRSISLRMCQ